MFSKIYLYDVLLCKIRHLGQIWGQIQDSPFYHLSEKNDRFLCENKMMFIMMCNDPGRDSMCVTIQLVTERL